MEKKKPLLSVRPKFDTGLAIVQSLPVTLVATVAVTFAAGTFFYILFSFIGLTGFVSSGTIYLVFFFLSLVLTPAVFYELKKKALSRTAYHFYDGYFEFQNFRFYINRRRGRVRYDDIADVTQHASFLQGLNALTAVYIYVPNMSYQAQGPFSGVRMDDIPDTVNAATRILDVIERKFSQTMPLVQPLVQQEASPVPAAT